MTTLDKNIIESFFPQMEKLSFSGKLELLEKLSKMLRKEKNNVSESEDWWNLTSEEEKKSIEKGILEADNNEVKPHSEARKIYEKWL